MAATGGQQLQEVACLLRSPRIGRAPQPRVGADGKPPSVWTATESAPPDRLPSGSRRLSRPSSGRRAGAALARRGRPRGGCPTGARARGLDSRGSDLGAELLARWPQPPRARPGRQGSEQNACSSSDSAIPGRSRLDRAASAAPRAPLSAAALSPAANAIQPSPRNETVSG